MKAGSDNFRAKGVEIQIYEPTLKEDDFEGYKVVHNLDEFKNSSDVIIVNRLDPEIEYEKDKIYTRDLLVML